MFTCNNEIVNQEFQCDQIIAITSLFKQFKMVPIESEEVFIQTVIKPLLEIIKESNDVKIKSKIFTLLKTLNEIINSNQRTNSTHNKIGKKLNKLSNRGANNGILNSQLETEKSNSSDDSDISLNEWQRHWDRVF